MNTVPRRLVQGPLSGRPYSAQRPRLRLRLRLLLGAGSARAMPISTLRTECRGAGGTWHTTYTYSGGVPSVSGYECWYLDIEGGQHVDYYDRRGNYDGAE